MDYRVASNIRGKSLSSLITDKITSGGSVGSSIKGAISDKLKAKGTGIKEKFDPMNIARAMTGGGKLAPAILGKITGRSQSDINYFAGNKKKSSSYTKMPSIGQVPGEGFGGSAIEVLNKMLSFMQKNREDDLKRKQTSMAFEEERQSEEGRRHNQFLKVLKDYTALSGGTTTIVKKEEDGGFLSGLMDTIKSMINSAIENALKAFEWIKELKTGFLKLAPYALRLAGFLAGPAGAALLVATSLAAFAYLANEEKKRIEADPDAEEFKDNPYAMTLRGEATTIGQATVVNQNKALKSTPRGTVKEFVDSDRSDEELKLDLGNDRATLKQWLQDNPKPNAMYQAPVAAIAGQPQTAIPAGGLPLVRPTVATPLPEGVTPSTAGAGRGTPSPAATDPKRSDLTTTPIPSEPPSSAVVGKIQENNDLNMQTPVSSGTSSSPSLSVNNSSTSAPDQTVTSTATTRDDTAILDFVLNRSKSRV